MSHLSDLALDRLLAGELEGTPEGEGARAHLAECALCEARRAEIVKDAEAFPHQVWIAGEAARVRAKLEAPARRRSWIASGAAIALAASIAAVALLPATDPAGTRTKGAGVSLSGWARHAADGRVAAIEDGEVLAAGDAVRFEVATAQGGALTVLGLDGRGEVSVYARLDLPGPLPRQALESSVVLDDAPIAERFFAVLCKRGAPSPEGRARAALQATGGDPRAVTRLGSGCREASFLVRKKER